MAHSENLNELATALAKAQSEFQAIPKSETNPFFKSKYASLPTVVEAASPIISKLGLSVAQFPCLDEHGDTLVTWLLHTSGQYINTTMRLHLNKDDAQSQGSAMTYARRYSYMAVLGLVADEDDDGNAASKPTHPKPMYAKKEPEVANTLPLATQTRLGGAVKLKGITDKQDIVNVLNGLTHVMFTAPNFVAITEPEAEDLYKAIVKAGKEELEMLK